MSEQLIITNEQIQNSGEHVMSLAFLDPAYHDTARLMRDMHKAGELVTAVDLDNTLGDARNGWVPGDHQPEPDYDLVMSLRELNKQNGGRTAIITGRPKRFVDSALPGVHLWTATEQGCVIHTPNGTEMSRQAVIHMDLLREAVEVCERKYGGRIEAFKTATMTFEFTQVEGAVRLAPTIANDIEAAIREHDPDQLVEVVSIAKPENCAIEILPSGINKRFALDIMTKRVQVFHNAAWAYFGDNNSDTPVMDKLKANRHHQGFIGWVGAEVPKRYRDYERTIHLREPSDTRQLLRFMIAG